MQRSNIWRKNGMINTQEAQKKVTGLKLLEDNGHSVRTYLSPLPLIEFTLPSNGKPGDWVVLPGDGIAVSLTDHIGFDGWGDLVAEMECVAPVGPHSLSGVFWYNKVRVIAAWPWDKLPERIKKRLADDSDEFVRVMMKRRYLTEDEHQRKKMMDFICDC